MSLERAAFPWLTHMSGLPKKRCIVSEKEGRAHTGRVDGSGNKSEQTKEEKVKMTLSAR